MAQIPERVSVILHKTLKKKVKKQKCKKKCKIKRGPIWKKKKIRR